ncbi:MAG: hypothetical protein E7191_06535 [Erysipelotrichaceae bacterium]|nr:hypothetical protein [Erysipelotrichaceae bacterium]
MGVFRIDVDDMKWINGSLDDPKDLCLHGHVIVQIGNTVMEGDGTVSATGLYLLKTLTQDKVETWNDIQMIPCCGHTLLANEDLSEVTISGCDKGIDWSTIHVGDHVKIILSNGIEEIVSLDEYTTEVFRFADKIKSFYDSCTSKILPTNEFDRNGYIAFWNEWNRRRG